MQNKQLQKYLDFLIKTTQEETSDSDGHILSLFTLALASKGKIYELGVRDGITTLPLLLAAYLNRGTLISVNIKNTKFICPPELSSRRKKAHLFKESRMKIWAKRWLKQISPDLERKFVYKYQELKQKYFKK